MFDTERLAREKAWLKAEAARLRAEAEALEAEQREFIARAAAEVFREFDLNNDGSISLEELRLGLMKELQDQVTPEQVARLMAAFDASGDGNLQIDEFKSVEEFRRKLDSIALEDREKAEEAAKIARKTKEEAAKLAIMAEIVNDGPPTFADRWVSILPYLVPLFDSFQYGQKFISSRDDTVASTLAVFYRLYASIPFSGLIAFFVLSFIANNSQLNRLIRFNIQQAIYIDIALIVPSLLSGVVLVGLPTLGVDLSPEFADLASTATFLVFASSIIYSLISSLAFGQIPNKIPIISDKAEERVRILSRLVDPTAEDDNKKPRR